MNDSQKKIAPTPAAVVVHKMTASTTSSTGMGNLSNAAALVASAAPPTTTSSSCLTPLAASIQRQNGPPIFELHAHDVVSGRGIVHHRHVGNRHFRQLVQDHLDEYQTALKPQKPAVARKIVALVHESGGRFLVPANGNNNTGNTSNVYYEMDATGAQEKTSQALRHRTHDLRRKAILGNAKSKTKKTNSTRAKAVPSSTSRMTTATSTTTVSLKTSPPPPPVVEEEVTATAAAPVVRSSSIPPVVPPSQDDSDVVRLLRQALQQQPQASWAATTMTPNLALLQHVLMQQQQQQRAAARQQQQQEAALLQLLLLLQQNNTNAAVRPHQQAVPTNAASAPMAQLVAALLQGSQPPSRPN